jgi:hypothetical protein
MSKRLLAAVLWFAAGWYVGAFVAAYLAVPALIGPILGFAAAAVFAGDPLGVIWTRRADPAATAPIDLEHLPEDLAQAA